MSILDLVFPKTCLNCGKAEKYICDDCLKGVKLSRPICPRCEKASIDGFTHTKCNRKLGLDGLTSIWSYEGVVRKAILALKFKHATKVGEEINNCIAREVVKSFIPKADILVPVPLYWYRENNRGFNQSEFVGRSVAEALKVGFFPDLLIRNKSTTPQVKLKGKDRRQNLRGVFALGSNYTPITKPYSLILFDDVYTTGSTLKEAAKVLKQAGVKKVWGLTIAKRQ